MAKNKLTTQELAGELGVSREWVGRLEKKGILRRENGRFDLSRSARAYVAYRLRNVGGTDATKLLKARLAKITADIRYAKLGLQKTRAQLVTTEEGKQLYEFERRVILEELRRLVDIVPDLGLAEGDRGKLFEITNARARQLLVGAFEKLGNTFD